MQEIKERLEYYAEITEAALEKYLPETECLQKNVILAARHSLTAGGKRIRPALVMEFCRVCGGEPETALPVACAVEMSVETLPNIIAVQKLQNFIAGVPFIAWWVMQEHQFRKISGRFQRCFQPHQFPSKDLFIMLGATCFFIKPPTCAANRPTIANIMVII